MQKKLLLFLLLSPLCLLAQTGSVQLKDAGGNIVGSYNTIAAAYADIPTTLSKAYIIEMGPTYTGSDEGVTTTFTAKDGASAVNTITLRPATGVASVSLTKAASGNPVIKLDDADYIIIDGRAGGTGTTRVFSIGNTATNSSANTIQLINGATNNIIRHCIINNATVASAGRNIHFSTSASGSTGNSDNRVEFCTINSGRYAINNNGTTGSLNTRNRIYGCDINTIRFVGLWVQAGCAKTYIDSCNIYCTSATGDTPYGVLGDAVTDSLVITRNKIYDLNGGTSTSTIRGISVRSITGTTNTVIENNFISLGGPAAPSTASLSVVGIDFTISATTPSGIFINNNTVRIMGSLASGGTSGNVVSSCLNFATTVTNTSNTVGIFNNIFINERAGGNSGVQHVAMSLLGSGGTPALNNNTFNASSGNLVRLGSTVYTSIAAYQAAIGGGNETNANDAAVQLVSETDLHLAGTSVGNNNLRAQPLTTISVDIDNQPRSTTRPYRGADESTTPLPLNFISFKARAAAPDAVLSWQTSNERNNAGFYVERSADGYHFTTVAFVAATANPAAMNDYSFTDKEVLNQWNSNQLYYRLKQTDRDGGYRYSVVVLLTIGKKDFAASIYPNPVKTNVQLSISVPKATTVSISILDINGKTLTNKSLTLNEGANWQLLTESGALPKGYYFLKITGADFTQTLRFVKE